MFPDQITIQLHAQFVHFYETSIWTRPRSGFKFKGFAFPLLPSIIWPPCFSNLPSADYLLTITIKFPNFPRPWPKMPFSPLYDTSLVWKKSFSYPKLSNTLVQNAIFPIIVTFLIWKRPFSFPKLPVSNWILMSWCHHFSNCAALHFCWNKLI